MTPDQTRIAGLEVVALPIGKIDSNPWNPNRQTNEVQRAERESIQTYGFIDPIAVRQHPDDPDRWQIIDGEHRWREAQALGIEEVPAVIIDAGEAEARKLTVILNETRGNADVVLLGALLADVRKLIDDEDTFKLALPFGALELEHLLAIGDEDWSKFTQSDGNGDGEGAAGEAPPDVRVLSLEFSDDDYAEFVRCVDTITAAEDGDGSFEPVVLAALRAYAITLTPA